MDGGPSADFCDDDETEATSMDAFGEEKGKRKVWFGPDTTRPPDEAEVELLGDTPSPLSSVARVSETVLAGNREICPELGLS